MERYRMYNRERYNYLGSSETKELAKKRAIKTGNQYRITSYGRGYKWASGYDIWVKA